MSPMESIEQCFAKYFDFKGRATRSEFWWFYLFSMLSMFAAQLVDIFVFGATEPMAMTEMLVTLAMIIPLLSVTTRRLHDRNLSGWWQFVALTIILMPLVVYWLARKGEEGENRFGPNPMGEKSVYSMVPPPSPGQVK